MEAEPSRLVAQRSLKESELDEIKIKLTDLSSATLLNPGSFHVDGVEAVFDELQDIQSKLDDFDFAPIASLFDKALIKVATYRAAKKMLDAEIAEYCSIEKKTIKLKTEAKEYLKLDWQMVIKNEKYPGLEIVESWGAIV